MPDHTSYLILVDHNDRQVGKMEKMEVHRLGLLHRAFSIFIFNTRGELLLQQRADSKYHSGGLWTNTCCSHPGFGESLNDAIERRLFEEMGMKAETTFAFSFIYHAQFGNGLQEHEFDHVYMGVSDALPKPDENEVKAWKYLSLEGLALDIEKQPAAYTEWFKACFANVKESYHRLFGAAYGA